METINYIVGDATDPVFVPGKIGPRVITHVCNDIGVWGAGFVMALSARNELPEVLYRRWWSDGQKGLTYPPFQLGWVRLAPYCTENDASGAARGGGPLLVANMIAQHGVGRQNGNVPLRIEALSACLEAVGEFVSASEGTVHMPRIGCGLAGGRWEEIEGIIQTSLCERGIPVFVYDLPGTQPVQNNIQKELF
jgi:hypothetical protein